MSGKPVSLRETPLRYGVAVLFPKLVVPAALVKVFSGSHGVYFNWSLVALFSVLPVVILVSSVSCLKCLRFPGFHAKAE
jgi:hypothetical protein